MIDSRGDSEGCVLLLHFCGGAHRTKCVLAGDKLFIAFALGIIILYIPNVNRIILFITSERYT